MAFIQLVRCKREGLSLLHLPPHQCYAAISHLVRRCAAQPAKNVAQLSEVGSRGWYGGDWLPLSRLHRGSVLMPNTE